MAGGPSGKGGVSTRRLLRHPSERTGATGIECPVSTATATTGHTDNTATKVTTMTLRALILTFLLLATTTAVTAAEGQRLQFLGLHSDVPADWVPEEVASSMRVLQLRVPAADKGEDVQFVAYYFGPNQGGSLDANVARWKSQFSKPDGGEVEPVITPLKGTFPANLVELEGSYARGMGMGQAGEVLPERMLLAAVVETPKGNLYPQIHGPTAVVKGLRDAFVAFVEGIKPDETP